MPRGDLMDFGISLLPDIGPDRKSAVTYYRDALRLSLLADEYGLRYVKMTEHYLHPYGGYCPAPLTFLASVAAQTEQIRLMTGGVIPNYHHPIQLASQVTMVDALSGGRLDVGFARGYLPYEYLAFGIPLDSSHDRFQSSVNAMIRLWTEEGVTEHTPYFSYSGATILPRPTQAPHPPLWAAAVRTPRSFEWIGRMGFGLLMTPTLTAIKDLRQQTDSYRKSFLAAHGQAGRQPRVAMSLPLYVAQKDAEAFRTGDALMAEYLRVWLDAADSWNTAWSKDYAAYTGMSYFLRGMSPTAWRETGSAAVGSVGRVIDRIHELRELADPDVVLWQVDFGGAPLELAEQNLRLFCDRVYPEIVTVSSRSSPAFPGGRHG
jgi:alkanesulfonate monooxygenase SsuD/methylene tetrahydromethanopterin reductase-like flavin-dependent oxidoreductase (luciferase family)